MTQKQTPHECFNYYRKYVNFDAGYIYVAFMKEDPDGVAPRYEERLGAGYKDGELARGLCGCLGSMFTRDVQIFCASFLYIHCEVVFLPNEAAKREFGADKMLAVLVNERDNVAMRWRHFDDRYKWIKLRATPKQIDIMLKFACTTNGEAFSGSQRNSVPLRPGVEQPTGWYCAKHVASMLRVLDCEMFHFTRTNTLTVDELHAMVENCNHFPSAFMATSKTPVELERIHGRQNVQEVIYDQYMKK